MRKKKNQRKNNKSVTLSKGEMRVIISTWNTKDL